MGLEINLDPILEKIGARLGIGVAVILVIGAFLIPSSSI